MCEFQEKLLGLGGRWVGFGFVAFPWPKDVCWVKRTCHAHLQQGRRCIAFHDVFCVRSKRFAAIFSHNPRHKAEVFAF